MYPRRVACRKMAVTVPEGYRRHDFMPSAGQGPQHRCRLFGGVGLSHHLGSAKDHRVGGEEDFVLLQRTVEAEGFTFGHYRGDLGVGDILRENFFERVSRVDREVDSETREQFLTPWGVTPEDYFLSFQIHMRFL